MVHFLRCRKPQKRLSLPLLKSVVASLLASSNFSRNYQIVKRSCSFEKLVKGVGSPGSPNEWGSYERLFFRLFIQILNGQVFKWLKPDHLKTGPFQIIPDFKWSDFRSSLYESLVCPQFIRIFYSTNYMRQTPPRV